MSAPPWLDPHISLDGIAAITVFIFGGIPAFLALWKRFNVLEWTTRSNSETLKDHVGKLERMATVMEQLARSDARLNYLEQIVNATGGRLDKLTERVNAMPNNQRRGP